MEDDTKIVFLLALVLITILLVGWYGFADSTKKITLRLIQTSQKINIDSFFNIYLKSPLKNATYSDYLLYFYYTGDSSILVPETNILIKKALGDVYWKIDIGHMSVTNNLIYDSNNIVLGQYSYTLLHKVETQLPTFTDFTKPKLNVTLFIYS